MIKHRVRSPVSHQSPNDVRTWSNVVWLFLVSGAGRDSDLKHTFRLCWNAFPHTHSWHVFFSLLSSWVWEPGDSCACSSSISQQDSKMDDWQDTKSMMKTSITRFFHLVNEHHEMQQHKTKGMINSCMKERWRWAAFSVCPCFLQSGQTGH